jgi:hypothetical protein
MEWLRMDRGWKPRQATRNGNTAMKDFSTKIRKAMYNERAMLPTEKVLQDYIPSRTMSFGQIAEEFDLVHIEVNGFLQPIPADKAQGICEVLELNRVFADTGEHEAEWTEIHVSVEHTEDMEYLNVNRIDPFHDAHNVEENIEDLLSVPFHFSEWSCPRPVFSAACCGYCNQYGPNCDCD